MPCTKLGRLVQQVLLESLWTFVSSVGVFTRCFSVSCVSHPELH